MAAKQPTRLQTLHAEIETTLKTLETAIAKQDIKTVLSLDAKLKELESEYSAQKETETYVALGKKKNPIIEAVKTLTFTIVGHKLVEENGVFKGVQRTTKTKRIDLYKFCKRNMFDTSWIYPISQLNYLLCLRVGRELGFTAEEITQLSNSYYLEEKAKQVKMGGTPDSNTQLCKMLQKCIDEIITKENTEGDNAYKCNNHDVAYLLNLYAKRGKKALTVIVAKDSYLRGIITDVLYRIVTGSHYTVDGFKKVTEQKPDEKKSEEAPAQNSAENK